MTNPSAKPPEQFSAGQIALWLVTIAGVFAQHFLWTFELAPKWMGPFNSLPIIMAFACIALVRSPRLFKPADQTIAPEALAALKRQGTRRAYRTGFWVVLAYTSGALVGSSALPTKALIMIGLFLTLFIGTAVFLWTSRRGAPLPV